jgi:hypothetical protein
MLTLVPTAVKQPSTWRTDAAFAILRDDADVGRIDLNGAGNRDIAAWISLGERAFECRIHATAKPRWTYVPSRWVMYAGDTALHGAICESNKTFVTESEAGLEPLRLRRAGFSGSFAVERASDETRVGEITRLRPRLLPKPAGTRFVLDLNLERPETFEVLLIWIAAQNDFNSSD